MQQQLRLMASPFYSQLKPNSNSDISSGQAGFDGFQKCFVLSTSQRQGNDHLFRGIFDRVGLRESTIQDHIALITRTASANNQLDIRFRDAI